jgi:hypothetical protein
VKFCILFHDRGFHQKCENRRPWYRVNIPFQILNLEGAEVATFTGALPGQMLLSDLITRVGSWQ